MQNLLIVISLVCMILASTTGATECPASHPNVYYNGRYCCKTNKEKDHTPQGTKCDGSVIQRDSLCCEGDQHTPCPSGTENCENYQDPNLTGIKIVSHCDNRHSYNNHGIFIVEEGCVKENYDFRGADIKRFGVKNVVSIEDCAALCADQTGCVSVTHQPATSRCWLKNKEFGADPQDMAGVNSRNLECKGYLGEVGEEGETGIPGSDGDKGAPGDKGARGNNDFCTSSDICSLEGVEGEPGADGIDGENGTSGNSGDVGSKGEMGREGYAGLPGYPGVKGMKGGRGIDGQDSFPGYNGKQNCGSESCDLKLGHCYGMSSTRFSVQCMGGYAATSIWKNTRFWGLRCCNIIGSSLN